MGSHRGRALPNHASQPWRPDREVKDTPPHLQGLEGIEKTCTSSLVEVLREEGIDAVRYALRETLRDGTGTTLPQLSVIRPLKNRRGRAGRWR